MSTQLQIERKDNWVVARLSGVADIEKAHARFEEIAQACDRMSTKRLIVDVTNAALPLSATDKFEMGRHAVVFAQHGIKVAVVATPDQLDPERFGEVVARNRGVNIRLFTDVEAAEEWLATE